MTDVAYGIDFGTTNSAAVRCVREQSHLVFSPIMEERNPEPIPSVVSYSASGREEVGAAVRGDLLTRRNSGSTVIQSVKSVIERDVPVSGHHPVDIAAALLRHISRCADATKRQPVIREAVFAIPVKWPAAKRRALREAAQRAGISVTAFVSEPSAALLAAPPRGEHEYILVFDWGGGTLDIAILQRTRFGWMEIAKTVSEAAGDYIDDQIARWLHERLSSGRPSPSYEGLPPRARQELLNVAEYLKITLQAPGVPEARYTLEHYPHQTHPDVTLARAELESLITPVVTAALEQLDDTIRRARIARERIGELLVIGGSSQLRYFRQRLEARSWAGPRVWHGPTVSDDTTTRAAWLVARGAAKLAMVGGQVSRVTSDIGLLVAAGGEPFYQLCQAGTPIAQIATPRMHSFGLVQEAGAAVFVLAERTSMGRCQRFGEISLPVQGFADEELQFAMHVDRDEVLKASAKSQKRPHEIAEFSYEGLSLAYELDMGA